MSELTTIARPYAKAAFDFAVEQSTSNKSAVEKWNEMLGFLAELVKNEAMQSYLTSSFSAQKLADTVISICGEQLDQYGQNLVRLMAENKRLTVLPQVFKEFQHYVKLNCNVDSSLIAGVIIRTEDFVIDGSSRGQLARLANELQL